MNRGMTLIEALVAVGVTALVVIGLTSILSQTTERQCLNDLLSQQTERARTFARGVLQYAEQNRVSWDADSTHTVTAGDLESLLPDEYGQGDPKILHPLEARVHKAGDSDRDYLEILVYDRTPARANERVCNRYKANSTTLDKMRERAVLQYARQQQRTIFTPMLIDTTSAQVEGAHGGFDLNVGSLLSGVSFADAGKRFALARGVKDGAFQNQRTFIKDISSSSSSRAQQLSDQGVSKFESLLHDLQSEQSSLTSSTDVAEDETTTVDGIAGLRDDRDELENETIPSREETLDDKNERIDELQSEIDSLSTLIVDKESLDFGSIRVDRETTRSVTVRNPTPEQTLELTDITGSGDNPNRFDAPNVTLPLSFPPESSRTIEVLYDPGRTVDPGPGVENVTGGVGEHTATMTLVDDNPDGDNPTVDLSGEADPFLDISGTELTFGETTLDESKVQSMDVRNATGTDLALSTVVQSATGHADDFDVAQGDEDFTLDAGRTRSVSVQYAPNDVADETHEAAVTINASNDQLKNPDSFGLQGQPVADLSLSDGSLSFGTVKVDETKDKTVTLSTSANQNLSFDVNLSGDVGSFSAPSSVTIPANSSTVLTVTYEPQDASDHSANLSLTNDTTRTEEVTISLGGTGKQPLSSGTKTYSSAGTYGFDIPEGATKVRITAIAGGGGGHSVSLLGCGTYICHIAKRWGDRGGQTAIPELDLYLQGGRGGDQGQGITTGYDNAGYSSSVLGTNGNGGSHTWSEFNGGSGSGPSGYAGQSISDQTFGVSGQSNLTLTVGGQGEAMTATQSNSDATGGVEKDEVRTSEGFNGSSGAIKIEWGPDIQN